MATLPFTKMHGIGNDYVYVDCFEHTVADPPALARRVSPRHTGVGTDGLILICPSERRRLPDGDVQRRRQPRRDVRQRHPLRRQVRLRARSAPGPIRCASRPTPAIKAISLHLTGDRRRRRSPSTWASRSSTDRGIPVAATGASSTPARGRRDDAPGHLRVDGKPALRRLHGRPTPMSRASTCERIGPRFENHPFFPKRVNTEFVASTADTSLTHARLGARLGRDRGLRHRRVRRAGRGGAQRPQPARRARCTCTAATCASSGARSDDHVCMTGPADEVFRGEIEVAS